MAFTRKFTIIIPTRDRADVLKYSLASAVAQTYPNLQIIVSDNASTDDTAKVVSGFDDKRITYINTGERLSMSHNWEFAISRVSDGWITVIGDDDAILPGAISKVDRIIEETGTQAVRANGCTYEWPQVLQSPFGALYVNLQKGYRKVDSSPALASVLRGCLNYTHLPMLYNGGFVDIALIKKVKKVTGNFYRSMTPDVYSAIALAMVANDYIYSDEPLAINGTSRHSGGTSAFAVTKKSSGDDPAEKYWSEKNIPFHEALPLAADGKPPLSLQALVYESYLQASPLNQHHDAYGRPGSQLTVILRLSGRRRPEIETWGKKFADLHGINFAECVRMADQYKPSMVSRASKVSTRLQSALSTYFVYGNLHNPLSNVWEASIIAGAMKCLPLKQMRNVMQRIKSHLNDFNCPQYHRYRVRNAPTTDTRQ